MKLSLWNKDTGGSHLDHLAHVCINLSEDCYCVVLNLHGARDRMRHMCEGDVGVQWARVRHVYPTCARPACSKRPETKLSRLQVGAQSRSGAQVSRQQARTPQNTKHN